MLLHNPLKAQPASMRLLVTVAAMPGYDIWSLYVSPVYLQSASNLARAVYVLPPQQFSDQTTHFLGLRKVQYSLSDSGDYWHQTLAKFLKSNIRLKSFTGSRP